MQLGALYLHRVFSFDQQDDVFAAGGNEGNASSAATATGGGESLITVILPEFLAQRRPLGSLRHARHLMPEQHLQ